MSDDVDFTSRVVIVTGAGGGLGRAFALDMARRGAKLVINDLGVSTSGTNPTSHMADETVAAIVKAGGTAIANHDNVGTRAGGEGVVAAAMDHFGRVDAVVVNAGLVRLARFEDQTDAQIDLIFDVNLKQGFYVGQPAYRVMKAQGYGRFVFMGSAVGMFGDAWQANYGASKAGLFALSNVIALEGAAHGIVSNVVLPIASSRMEEQMRPEAHQEAAEIGAMAATLDYAVVAAQLTPAHVAPLVTYLASEDCTTTHGVFSALGGRYARVAVSVGEGWRDATGTLSRAEDVAAHWAAIEDDRPVGRPQHVQDEFRIAIDRIKATAGG